MTDERPRPGPPTRAIRAASRVPDVHATLRTGCRVTGSGEIAAEA